MNHQKGFDGHVLYQRAKRLNLFLAFLSRRFYFRNWAKCKSAKMPIHVFSFLTHFYYIQFSFCLPKCMFVNRYFDKVWLKPIPIHLNSSRIITWSEVLKTTSSSDHNFVPFESVFIVLPFPTSSQESISSTLRFGHNKDRQEISVPPHSLWLHICTPVLFAGWRAATGCFSRTPNPPVTSPRSRRKNSSKPAPL